MEVTKRREAPPVSPIEGFATNVGVASSAVIFPIRPPTIGFGYEMPFIFANARSVFRSFHNWIKPSPTASYNKQMPDCH